MSKEPNGTNDKQIVAIKEDMVHFKSFGAYNSPSSFTFTFCILS
jgi:hypothetical protein